MPAGYPGEMRTEATKGQEPGVEAQIRDVSPAGRGAVPIGTADTVTAVFGPSDSRHKELRDIFRRATNATKMIPYAEGRKKSSRLQAEKRDSQLCPEFQSLGEAELKRTHHPMEWSKLLMTDHHFPTGLRS